MKIVADENIARVEVFKDFGDLWTLPGREINREQIKDADVLLVRSITKVNESLVNNSSLKFIASATSGIDHVDTSFLAERGIAFHAAPGCNAQSVVEYVFSALAFLSQKKNFDWRQAKFGIVGAGNIGGLLANYLKELDITFSIYDPYLNSTSNHGDHLVSFSEIVKQDIISLHAPLTIDGEHPTYHLFNEKVLANLASTTSLINAARGGIIDNTALLKRLELNDNDSFSCVLDAWEHEPDINLELLNKVDLGTPHIAGYSLDGKLKGTLMILNAFCDFFKLENFAKEKLVPPTSNTNEVPRVAKNNCDLSRLNKTLLSAYEIERDYKNMQALLQAQNPAGDFDRLRKTYPVRLEYSFEEKLPIF